MKKEQSGKSAVVAFKTFAYGGNPKSPRRLSWGQIKDFYAAEWVELVDYKWPWNETNPTSAVVRCHAQSREELDLMRSSLEPKADALILFMGASPSLFQLSVNAAV